MFLGGASAKDLRKGAKVSSSSSRSVIQSSNGAAVGAALNSSSLSKGFAPTSVMNFSTHVSSSVDDKVAEAAIARQQRELLREQAKYAGIIQRYYRSYHALVVHLRLDLTVVEHKLTDIAKLATLLKARGGVTFVPPVNVIADIFRMLFTCRRVQWALLTHIHSKLYGKARDEDRTRILRALLHFIAVALLPSIAQEDPDKNWIAWIFNTNSSHGTELAEANRRASLRIMRSLVWAVVTLLFPVHYSWTGSGMSLSSEQAQTLLQALSLILGINARHNPNSAVFIEATCFVRQAVLPAQVTAAAGRFAVHSLPDTNYHLFSHLRGLITDGTRALVQDNQTEMTTSAAKAAAAKMSHFSAVGTVLICDVAAWLCEVDSSAAQERRRAFFLNILTAPLAFYGISPVILRATFFPKRQPTALLLQAILEHARTVAERTVILKQTASTNNSSGLSSEGAYLPPCVHDGLSSGQFLLGNLACLATCLDVRGSTDSSAGTVAPVSPGAVPDALLSSYLDVCLGMLRCFYVPGVFDGKGGGGVVWVSEGARRSTVYVPPALQEQVLQLLDKGWMNDLIYRILLPLREDLQLYCGPTKGTEKQFRKMRQEIDEVLTQDSLSVASGGLERARKEEAESNSWLSSRWASRIVSSIGKTFSRAVGLAAGSSEGSGATGSNSAGMTALAENPLPDTIFVMPPISLLYSLTALWSYVLPSAALHPGCPAASALNTLAFASRAIDRLWVSALKFGQLENLQDLYQPRLGHLAPRGPVGVLVALAALLTMNLRALDDHELYSLQKPLPLPHILQLVQTYKIILFKTLDYDAIVRVASNPTAAPASAIADEMEAHCGGNAHFCEYACRAMSSVLTDLYTRWSRRPFALPELWTVQAIQSDIARYRVLMRSESHVRGSLAYMLLQTMPWAWDLNERLKLFRDIVDEERSGIQLTTDERGMLRNRSVLCQIRRKHLLMDGLKQLEGLPGHTWKSRMQIQYVNEFGENEAGIDSGGLFKDFVTDLSALIFNPNYGLFCSTEAGLLYPNPQAGHLYEEHELEKLYTFLGLVLGKVLYENITIQPRFAQFFLNFMHSKYNFQNMVQDLRTLDAELYKNLMFLKTYPGDVADLSLTFAVDDTSRLGGERSEIELFPGGSKVDVTSTNRLKYINLVAKYYLHDRIKKQSGAFFHGLYQVITPLLLGMFGAPELQVLISGTLRAVSTDDLRAHTQYHGYFSSDTYMRRFWTVFDDLDAADKGRLVKFVTSCERPPSLGFSALQPPFTIQRVDCTDDSRLPTASTCFNILKLPTYSSSAALRAKLLQAIRSGSGFDLS